jgi:hypothetical protein
VIKCTRLVSRPLAIVALCSLLAAAFRVVWVVFFPDIDGDAYGHFGIAIRSWHDPTNLHVHWVWLPLYHFVVGALSALGLSFRGLRIANALLQIATPILLFDAVKRRVGEEEAFFSALALTLAPLATVMATSAQYETSFTFFVVLSIFWGVRARPIPAGIALAIACFLRYEAWGAALTLCIVWAIQSLRKKEERPAFATLAIPAALIVFYILFRWWWDHSPLAFLRGTREFTTNMVARKEWTLRDIIHFPIVLPFDAIGPAILLVPFGLRRALALDWMLPLGLAGFLLLSYYGSGSPPGERYLISLVPFACVAIAIGALRIGERIRRPRIVPFVALALLALMTARHFKILARIGGTHEGEFRAREAELARLADDPKKDRAPP